MMKRDNTLNRAALGLLVAGLTYSVTVTAVPTEMRPPLEFTPPVTGALELAQSDDDSLQRALKLLESRAESNNNAPATPAAPLTPAAPPPAPRLELDTQRKDAAPPPPTPAPTLAPAPTPAVMPTPASVPDTTPPAAAPRPIMPSAVESKPAPTPTAIEPPRPPLTSAPPAQPAPAPAATSRRADPPRATATAPATASTRWQVQLLAGRVLSRVEQDRDDLLRFHGEQFNGVTLEITPVRSGGPYRLRAHDWANRAEAQTWCQRVQKATRLQCQVVPPEAAPAAGR